MARTSLSSRAEPGVSGTNPLLRRGVMAVDPVCGTEVSSDSVSNQERHEYAGDIYLFCSSTCKRRFVEEPDMYTGDPGMGIRANRDG